MRFDLTLPGVADGLVVETGLFGVRQVTVGGQPVARGTGKGKPFLIPIVDGRLGELRYQRDWRQPEVIFEQQAYPVGRRLGGVDLAIVALPLGLVPLFGLLGVVPAVVASTVNGAAVRSRRRRGVRYAAAGGSTFLATLAALALSIALLNITKDAPAAWARVGACWKALPTTQMVRDVSTVDCGTAHAAEVYAIVPVTPGDIGGTFAADRLTTWSDGACRDAFTQFADAALAAKAANLGLFRITPSSESWAAGDRNVFCALVDATGAPLVGSLKGPAPTSP